MPVTRSRAAAVVLLAALATVVAGPAVAGPAVAAPAVAAPAVAAAAATDDVTWGVRTATNDHGADRENFRYTLDPGATLTDELVVTNHGDAPLRLDVYAADGYTTTAGQLDVLTRETDSAEVGSWLEPGVEQVRLDPGESADVPFTLRVPDDATPGDYAGAILTSRTVTAQEAGLDYETRSGVRVYLRVAGDLAPSLTVVDQHVEYHQNFNPFGPGDATVTYTVRNDGNVRLAAHQEVSVAGPFGWFRATAEADDVPELLPGESWPVSVSVPGVVPAFRVDADAVLVAELPEVAGATPGAAPVEARASGWAVPWLPLALLVLIVVAVVVLVRRRRSRRLREDARVQAAVEKALAERDAGLAAESAAAEPGSPESADAEPGSSEHPAEEPGAKQPEAVTP